MDDVKLNQNTNIPTAAPVQPPPRKPGSNSFPVPAWAVPKPGTTDSLAGQKPDGPAGPAGNYRPVSLERIVKQASRRGNLTETLNRMLGHVPEQMEKFHLVNAIEDAWIDRLSGGLKPVAEAIRRDIEQKRTDLAGPSPTPLEKTVIDQIVAQWLAAEYASLAEATSRGGDVRTAGFIVKRAESANRRYLRTCNSLAQIRKLQQGLRIEICHTSPAPAKAGVAAEAAKAMPADTNVGAALPAGAPASAAAPPQPPAAERLKEALTEARRQEAAIS